MQLFLPERDFKLTPFYFPVLKRRHPLKANAWTFHKKSTAQHHRFKETPLCPSKYQEPRTAAYAENTPLYSTSATVTQPYFSHSPS